jgi:hypothetical protein
MFLHQGQRLYNTFPLGARAASTHKLTQALPLPALFTPKAFQVTLSPLYGVQTRHVHLSPIVFKTKKPKK